jgi:hypothetical protein
LFMTTWLSKLVCTSPGKGSRDIPRPGESQGGLSSLSLTPPLRWPGKRSGDFTYRRVVHVNHHRAYTGTLEAGVGQKNSPPGPGEREIIESQLEVPVLYVSCFPELEMT